LLGMVRTKSCVHRALQKTYRAEYHYSRFLWDKLLGSYESLGAAPYFKRNATINVVTTFAGVPLTLKV
jgi:hypothetical protein